MKYVKKFSAIFLTAVLFMTSTLCASVYAVPEDTNESEKAQEETSLAQIDKKETEWNIYVYMCPGRKETDSKQATKALNSMLSSDASEDLRFIVQTGGASTWHSDFVDSNKLERFVITGDKKDLVWEGDIKSMAHPDSLSDFIKWGKKNFPSKKSMLVLWGEGNAYKGILSDEIYDGETLSLADIKEALKNSGAHFDILSFDASQMADLDVLLSMMPYTDYVLASEEAVEGTGQDYGAIGSYIALNRSCDAKSLGKVACGAYVDNLHNEGVSITNGLSLIETSKLPLVRSTFSRMVRAMKEKMDDDKIFSEMLGQAYLSKGYLKNGEKDLLCFSEAIKEYIGEDLSKNVYDAVRKAVVAKAQTKEGAYNNGISFYWAPSSNESDARSYVEASSLNEYIAFVDALSWSVNAPDSVYEKTDRLLDLDYDTYAIKHQMKKNSNGFNTLKIASGQNVISSITYNVFGTYDGRSIKIANLGDISFNNARTDFKTSFDGRVVAINGQPIVLNVIQEMPSYVLYNAPIYIENNENVELKNLRVAYIPNEAYEDSKFAGSIADEEHGTFAIVGIEESIATSASNSPLKDSKDIKYETTIYPAYLTQDGNTYIKGEAIKLSEDTKVATKQLDDGTYYLNYVIKSSLGKEYTTELEAFEIEGGKINVLRDALSASNIARKEYILSNHKNGSYHLNKVSYKDYYKKPFVDRTKETVAKDEEEKKAKVTLMIYMIDYGTEVKNGVFTKNIESFMEANESEDVNIILQTGGGFGWKADAFDPNSVERFEIHNGKLVAVSKEPGHNMSTEASLEDYITWCKENYPAEHYMIEFFDHGAAWHGLCVDEKYGSLLSLSNIGTAMKNSGVHFDMVYCNLCLMSTLEVAEALRPYADVLLASEEATMAIPKSEKEMVNFMVRHVDNLDFLEVGKHKAESFLNDIDSNGLSQMYQSLSVIDLSKIPAVTDAVNKMGKEMTEIAKDPKKLTKLIRGLESSRKYTYDFMRDLNDLTKNAEGVSAQTKSEVINAVNDAIYYMASNKDYTRNGGLSIHYDIKGKWDSYSKICPAKDYLAFIDCANLCYHSCPGILSSNEKAESISPLDYVVSTSTRINDDEKLILKLESDPDIVNSITYMVSRYDEKQDKYYSIYSGLDIDYDDESKELTNGFDGRGTDIGGANCYMSEYYRLSDRTIYQIPVMYEGVLCNILVSYYPPETIETPVVATPSSAKDFLKINPDYDSGKFEILGLIEDGSNTYGYPDVSEMELKNGMQLTIQIPEWDENGKNLGYVDGDTIIWDEDMGISLRSLKDDDYVLSYVITDGILRNTVSDFAKITMKNDRIKSISLDTNQ